MQPLSVVTVVLGVQTMTNIYTKRRTKQINCLFNAINSLNSALHVADIDDRLLLDENIVKALGIIKTQAWKMTNR